MADSDKRLRYYTGQFLQEQDFTAEQEYHLDRQRRHNRQLHTPGIADGLAVTAGAGATSATVAPGTAIDGKGRTIILTESRNVSFGSLTGSVLVVISYKEQTSDPATAGDTGDTRWWEQPDVAVIAEAGAPAADSSIRLARLQIAANGTVSQNDLSVRAAAVAKLAPGNLKIQNPLGASPQFVQDQNGNQSPLAVGTGNVGIGTNDLECVFTIAGNVSSGPIAEARSQGDTASIQYVNKNGGFWHAGVGPANNFFFWNKPNSTSTLITPDGIVTANGLKLSHQGVAADVTGDISVTGKILVTGTVDGRDVSVDGAKLDSLASSTLKGVANPGGNVDLVGQTGITVTGNNTAKTITIAGAAGNLTTPSPLGAANQFVRDQNGNQSPLAIGTGKNVGIGTSAPGFALSVAGNISTAPIAEMFSQGDEASIRYLNNDQMPWHVGTGGQAGPKNFFFWNDQSHIVATITPDGTVATNALKLSRQGVAADVTGDLSVTGKVIVTGTVDGRDVSADGAKLDTLALSTVKGVSNPGGNIDLVGQAGITITGNNTTKAVTIAGAAGNLTTPNPLGAANQFVRDQNGNQSPLSLGGPGSHVGVGTLTPGYALTVAGDTQAVPLLEAFSVNSEASIRYMNLTDNVPWHAGAGGTGGAKNFFFWNQTNGVVAKIALDGTLTLNGALKASTNNPGFAFTVAGNCGTAPLVEMKNQGNEATIRYLNSDGVAWHVGTGGNGGTGNFFFWNQTNAVVGTMTPDGTLTVKGGLAANTIPLESTAPDLNRLRSLKIDPVTGKIYRSA